jgi:DNA (cytosine-5)-methyltransferase 1
VLHFIEDIRTFDLMPAVTVFDKVRKHHPKSKILLHASLECTNFSKAKGGQPRDADSRTLAEYLFRYIESIYPDYIQIENVEEFMCWGDLDENGNPISRDKGAKYMKWVKHVEAYGYAFNHRILNAADYGAYTSRKRFFGIFAKDDLPITFPNPNYSKTGGKNLFDTMKKWKPVKDVLDFSDEGESIFTRKKPLSDKTLERIYAGLIKFVAGGKDKFLSKYYSGHPESKNFSVEEPAHTVTPVDHHALINASFIQQRNSGAPKYKVVSVERPARTITATCGNQELVQAKFLGRYNGQKNQEINAVSIEKPAPTLTVKDSLSLVSPKFIVNNYSGGGQNSDINNPSSSVMTVPKQNLVQCKFIDQQYGNSNPSGIDNPLGCITANPKYNLVGCTPWIMNTNFENIGSAINEPSQTVTANRKWHYLMNPQFYSIGSSINDPCFTLIASMDKMPPYLVATETGKIAIEVYETDSEPMRRIKRFMSLYGIADIKMRMLKINELKLIMGFPVDYTLIGTKATQKKFIGNAVEVNMAKVLCEALVEKLSITIKQ